MTYEIIATGSDGNAVIINDHYLIDCGVPFKKLIPYVPKLRLVLLTHIHSDHFNKSTVRRLAFERPALRFGCCQWMIRPLLDAGVQPTQLDLYKCGFWTGYPGFYLSPVQLTHNVENCGYRIDDGSSRALYATDTGTMEGIKAQNYDLYFLEANHRREELEARIAEKQAAGEFAYEIEASKNHLSYEQAMDWLAENMGPTSLWVPMHRHKGGADHG